MVYWSFQKQIFRLDSQPYIYPQFHWTFIPLVMWSNEKGLYFASKELAGKQLMKEELSNNAFKAFEFLGNRFNQISSDFVSSTDIFSSIGLFYFFINWKISPCIKMASVGRDKQCSSFALSIIRLWYPTWFPSPPLHIPPSCVRAPACPRPVVSSTSCTLA